MPPAKKSPPEQVNGTFGLQPPTPATFLHSGEAKAVAIGLKRGMRFKEDEDLTLTFTDTDVPKGVTFDPAHPVIRHPDTEAKFTIKAADGAALGDFAIKVTGRAADGGAVSNLFNLSVVPKGD